MLGAFMYFCIWIFLQPFRWLLCDWKVEGLEHLPERPQGFALATNHLHWLDILVIGTSLPLRYRPWWIAKIELFDNRFAAWWFRTMQVIAIRRGKRDLTAMHTSEAVLKQGAVLVVFTEGHRSKTGQLQEGRGGAIRLAARSQTPILPMALTGTEAGIASLVFRRTPLRVRFAQPYHPQTAADHISPETMNVLTHEMMLKIAALLPEERWGFYREQMLQLP